MKRSFFSKRLHFVGVFILLFMLAACGGDGDEEAAGNDDDGSGGSWEPEGTIEMIAPAGAGGGWDTLARTTSSVLEESGLLPVAMGVENMPGAGGAIGWSHIANHEGDPHHLFVTSPPIILVPMTGDSDHDHTDFTPLARLITDYMIIGVSDDSPYETLDDLVNDLKAGEQVSVAGGSAPGSMDHIALAGALIEAGVPAENINYTSFEGGGEAIAAAVGGHADVVTTGVGESSEHVRSGNIRILGVSAPEGTELPGDAKTYQEQGIDFTFDIWRGVMGPKDMPQEAVEYYENLFANMLESDEWIQAADDLGWVDAYLNSEDFSSFLDEQQELFSEVLENIDY
ncbi:tripartite tricarboxylate transporter substrate binding protein [Evansella halocellulosilytica]|uniref:tripartite tricarboxylate transporter substrate binding protein n=1 Tax=Evansella halocellulosilytica TaxID=2011013 RepID=UPI000BB95647|nr:tripartite tricarboxylate transporter substrate binding protein [Evansella halocellulosilytica]